MPKTSNGKCPKDSSKIFQLSFLFLHANYLAMLSVCSGYDFAYLLKVLTAQNLPSEESEFFDLLKLYFPNIYDVKYLMKSCKSLKGGLQEVAELLEVCSFMKFFNFVDKLCGQNTVHLSLKQVSHKIHMTWLKPTLVPFQHIVKADYFDSVMTKFIVNNRTDAFNTDIKLSTLAC